MATYSDDFSGSTGGSPPTGWTSRWGAHQLTTDTAGAAAYIGGKAASSKGTVANEFMMSMDAVGTVADVEVLARTLEGSSTINYSAGVGVRCGGTASSRSGYVIRRDNDVLKLFCSVPSVWTVIASTTVPFSTKTEWVWWRLRAIGSTISAKTWRCSEPEPSGWQVSVTNSGVSAAGWAGVRVEDVVINNYDYYYDYVSIGTGGDTAPMPANGSGQLRVTSAYLEMLTSRVLAAPVPGGYVALCVN